MAEAARAELCVGVDVGGTFTDAVLTDTGRTWRAKAPTTPGELGRGVLDAVRLAAARSGRTLEVLIPQVTRFGLGTTAVTNALASRTGRRVGLLTTAGFEGMLPFARGTRVQDEDGWLAAPPALVARRAIAPIRERIDRAGAIVTPLDPAEVVRQVRRLVAEERVEAFAVSYLWSFLNPLHEKATAAAIAEAFPELPVVTGSALYPAIREYERTTYAVLNAYVSGALGGIEELEAELARLGLRVPLLLVHSAGGSISVAEARRQPLGLAASGPSAGVSAAIALARTRGVSDAITADMGGTSFDVSIVSGGEPARRIRGEIAGVWTALSMLDVESIGSGGGSLGWVDPRGMLRVGPRSAGAVPGPACYGRGGSHATVTDALVVLGFIDPQRFLGGDFALDREAARAACARLGEALGLSAEDTAWGIRQIALADMIRATRGRCAALGVDPRTHALLSFGGSGSLFTLDIAQALEVPQVLVPELASVLSAFGAATSNVRRERIGAVLQPMPVDAPLLRKLLGELAGAVSDDLTADGVPPGERSLRFEADLRFTKQVFELQVPLEPDADSDPQERALAAFEDEYVKRYGQGSIVLGAPIELVSLRAVGSGSSAQVRLADCSAPPTDDGVPAACVGTRSVQLERGAGGTREVAVFDGAALRPGHAIAGPALIDGSDTTVWLPAGTRGRIDANGTCAIEVKR